MLRDELWRRMVRVLVAGSLLLATADVGADMRAKVDLSDQARATAPFASATASVYGSALSSLTRTQTQSQAPDQLSTGQNTGHIVCPVTEATNPPLSAALFTAQALYRSGKLDEAIGAYDAAVPSGGNEAAGAYAGLARVYLKQQKVAEAYDAAMKAV